MVLVGSVIVPVLLICAITGVVNVLFVRVSVVALPTSVSVAAGRVSVTSAVLAGPISVTLLVPLSESSKNSKNPALVAPFLSWIPAFATGVVRVGVVSVLLVSVCVSVKVTRV